jgi:hypothetical protein
MNDVMKITLIVMLFGSTVMIGSGLIAQVTGDINTTEEVLRAVNSMSNFVQVILLGAIAWLGKMKIDAIDRTLERLIDRVTELEKVQIRFNERIELDAVQRGKSK